VNYLLAVIAAGLLGIGFVLQQRVAEQLPKGRFLSVRLMADLVRDRRWLAGLFIMVAGQLVSAWVIGHLVLSIAEPLLASDLLFALLLAWPLSRQRLSRTELIGALTLIAGVAALSLARSTPAAEISVGSLSNWPLAATVVAFVSYGFAVLGQNRSGDLRATLTGVSAGLLFGLQDALTRSAVQTLAAGHLAGLLTSWPGYAVVVVGVTAVWLMESAFSAAPLYASLPAITAGEPVTGIALGIVVFGDRLHTTPVLLGVQAAGFAALVTGVVLVARGPAIGGVRIEPCPAQDAEQPNGTKQD